MRQAMLRSTESLVALSAAVLLAACGCGSAIAAQAATPAAAPEPPDAHEAAGATYRGVEEAGESITLASGRWEGRPFVDGGASRPVVGLIDGSLHTGDLDGDGADESVVLLWSASGGSGTRTHVAVLARSGAGVENVATRLLGDRVQLRDLRIAGGALLIDVVRAGPEDAACCPGELASYAWSLDAGDLEDRKPPAVTGRLALAVLEGDTWTLSRFARDEPAPPTPAVTLGFAAGQFSGSAGCNNYFAAASEGEAQPGAIGLGPVGATRRMCAEAEMAVEDRFLAQLGKVSRFGFMNGRLILDYGDDVMLFDRVIKGDPDRAD